MRLKIVLSLLSFVVGVSLAQAESPTYIRAEKCGKLCHKVEYTSWLTTKHAKAFGNLPAADQAKKECISCHITGGTKDLPGVQCEACHGPGSEYKSLQIMKSREKSLAAGLVIPTEKVCLTCHNSKSPHFKGFKFAEMAAKVHEKKPKSK